MSSADLDVTLVVENGVQNGKDHTDRDTEESEATNTLGPAAVLLVDDWKCAEKHVPSQRISICADVRIYQGGGLQCAVNDGHVDGKEEDDWLAEKKNPRA